jgi:hypothetical protein
VRAFAVIALAMVATASGASADPAFDHVVDAPTAWLPNAGAVIGEAALDQNGEPSIALGYGLGGIAAVELGADGDVRTCGASCTQPPAGDPGVPTSPLYQGRTAGSPVSRPWSSGCRPAWWARRA